MFHPNMQAITQGFVPVSGPACRNWNGVMADVWDVEGLSGASGEYISPHPRLFVVLDQNHPAQIQISTQQRNAPVVEGRLSFIPAGTRTYSFIGQQTHLRHLDLHFDASSLLTRLGTSLDPARLTTPRLMFDNPRLLALAGLLAHDCTNMRLHDLYGESLVTAMLVELFEVGQVSKQQKGRLSPRRLRQAREYLDNNCFKPVRLQDLADLLDLSQSYFCTAFRASTGVTPHQWLMQARIERVKTMLQEDQSRISDVASVAGFSDQAHLTRVFKRYVGLTPAAWLQHQGGKPAGER